MNHSAHPFSALTPERILDALESLGLISDACILPLNSYENRVYRVGLVDAPPVVIKFYRPQRWSSRYIQEELDYLFELQEEALPVVAPMCFSGQSLFFDDLFYYAVFPLQAGRAPDFSMPKVRYRLGRQLARLHNIAEQKAFQQRVQLNITQALNHAMQTVLHSPLMPEDYKPAYASLAHTLPAQVEQVIAPVVYQNIRVHGDLHQGNLLDNQKHIMMLDFDDCKMAPAIQDIWLLLHGSEQEQSEQLEQIKIGYEELAHFPQAQLPLIEPLRTLRQVQYAAWLAERWHDPAFPIAFPWFSSHHFWSQHVMQLKEQSAYFMYAE